MCKAAQNLSNEKFGELSKPVECMTLDIAPENEEVLSKLRTELKSNTSSWWSMFNQKSKSKTSKKQHSKTKSQQSKTEKKSTFSLISYVQSWLEYSLTWWLQCSWQARWVFQIVGYLILLSYVAPVLINTFYSIRVLFYSIRFLLIQMVRVLRFIWNTVTKCTKCCKKNCSVKSDSIEQDTKAKKVKTEPKKNTIPKEETKLQETKQTKHLTEPIHVKSTPSPFDLARNAAKDESVEAAMKILWEHAPKEVMLHYKEIKENLRSFREMNNNWWKL